MTCRGKFSKVPCRVKTKKHVTANSWQVFNSRTNGNKRLTKAYSPKNKKGIIKTIKDMLTKITLLFMKIEQ